jgi:hyaluronoglucosaminidase
MNKSLFRNAYHLNSFLYFNGKVKLCLVNEADLDDEFFSERIDKSKFELDKDSFDFKLRVFVNPELKEDGYKIYIKKDNIELSSANTRGMIYAINFFNEFCEITENGFRLPITFVEDEPSFKYRGIIEGYYGTPWTFEERKDMIDFIVNNRLNSYIYAPKTDEYHRAKWCDLYPEDFFNELKKLFEETKKNEIDFYYTISPGYIKEGDYAFDYTNKADFERLYRKIDQFIEIGVTNFGLLLDDIDYKISENQQNSFPRPGLAHAYICNALNQYLASKIEDYKMVMCPTEYHHIGESQYRTDLKENLDENIFVFFTGDNVCAEAITQSDMALTKAAYGKELFIWDNFPVSDFTYGVREFIAPLTNRYTKMHEYAPGFFINPSIHYHISKIGMQTMAEYAWNSEGYDEEKAFTRALRANGEEFYQNCLDFVEFNFPSVLDYGKLHEYNHLVETKKYQELKLIYRKAVLSAEALLKMKLPIIEELKPWLLRLIKEEKLFIKIVDDNYTKSEVLEFLEDKHFLGMEIIDNVIKQFDILTKEEYEELITKRRGRPWYRVFEEKRWKK